MTDSVRNLTDTYSYPANTAGNTTDTQNVGTSGSDLVQTVQTTAADGYESSRASTVTNGPSLTRAINSRDNAKRVTKATLAAGQPTSIFSQFSYDAAGHMTKQWGPDTGDGSGFLAAASTTNAYTYSTTTGLKTADNLQLQSVGTAGPISNSYAYDSYGRLQSAVTNGSTETDQFDANGNLTSIGSGSFSHLRHKPESRGPAEHHDHRWDDHLLLLRSKPRLANESRPTRNSQHQFRIHRDRETLKLHQLEHRSLRRLHL